MPLRPRPPLGAVLIAASARALAAGLVPHGITGIREGPPFHVHQRAGAELQPLGVHLHVEQNPCPYEAFAKAARGERCGRSYLPSKLPSHMG